MEKLFSGFQKKLIDLSTGNKHIFQKSLRKKNHIDFTQFNFELGQSSFELFKRTLQEEKGVQLCSIAHPKDPDSQQLSIQLMQILRTQRLMREETGQSRLFLAWPWVSGKLDDGRYVHAPLLYWPVNLEQKSGFWVLQSIESPELNEAIKLLLKTFGKWSSANGDPEEESFPSTHKDITQFRIDLYHWLKSQGAMIDFTTRLFEDQLIAWQKPVIGEEASLKLVSHNILGIFQPLGGHLANDLKEWQKNNTYDSFEDFLGSWFMNEHTSSIHESSILTPIRLDDSQEKCFKEIRKGKSLVIQGPPGSGKSQLIAALATDYMARGKKVLIIAQKRVALEVITRKMQSLGIVDFATLLTDHFTDRKSVYSQISKQIASIPYYQKENNTYQNIALEREFSAVCKQIDQLEEFFSTFRAALYQTKEAGITPQELYLEDIDPEWVQPAIELVPELKLDQWTTIKPLIQKWWRYQEFFKNIPQGLDLLLNADRHIDLLTAWKDLEAFVHLWEQFSESYQLSHFALSSEKVLLKVDRAIFEEDNTLSVASKILEEDLFSILEQLRSFYEKVKSETWSAPLVDLDFASQNTVLDALNKALTSKDGWLKNLKFQFTQEHAQLKKMFGKAFLNDISSIKECKSFILKGIGQFKVLQSAGIEIEEKCTSATLTEKLERQVERARILKDLLSAFGMNKVPTNWKDWFISAEKVETRFHQVKKSFDPRAIEFYVLNSDELEKTRLFLSQNREDLTDFKIVLEELRKVHRQLSTYLVKVKLVSVQESQFMDRVWSGLVVAWLHYLENLSPSLAKSQTLGFQSNIESLQSIVLRKEELAAQLLRIRLKERTYTALEYNRLQNRVSYRELDRQLQKKKQIWPLRKLMTHFSEEIFDLVPCWLMSPESVSSAMPLEALFDLILIDESSQLFAERALPALFRSRHLVVCGDHQQLSPNDLYTVRYEEEEEDDPELQSVSLLHLMELHLETHLLRGHYRSMYPELIAFSNQQFYAGRLKPIVSTQAFLNSSTALIAEKMSGIWENQTNLAEAKRAADLFIAYQSLGYSVGVISFNYPQMQLILSVLEDCNAMLNSGSFVKNLENVQGDEADVIIISPAYALDKEGKFSLNFGLLSKEGGSNRLNVAITRSRIKMHVLYSFEPTRLLHAHTTHPAAGLLASFVNFALANVTQSVDRSKLSQTPPGRLANKLIQSSTHSCVSDFADVLKPEHGLAKITDDDRFFEASSMKQWFGWQAHTLQAYGWSPSFEFSRAWYKSRLIAR